MPVSAKNANGMSFFPKSAGIAITSDATETAITALNGTRSLLTRLKMAHPGIPRSRENAYQVREALVSPAAPQKNWPTVAISTINFAAQGSSALLKIPNTAPPESLTAATSVAANRKARRTNHPITADQNTERQTPCAAAVAAPRVSSAVCAEASYPVWVYIASRKPTGRTRNQNPRPPVSPPSVPVSLNRSPKTKPKSWWSSGTKTSSAMITATPSRCQPTEMLFISARIRSAKMFTTV